MATKHIVCTRCGRINRVPTDKQLASGQCGACKSKLSADTPIDISETVLNRLLAKDEGSFLLDVWAPWCGPCRMMAPAYMETAKHYGGALRFLKLNTEAFPNAGAALNVRGIPALLMFQSGSIVDQRAGVMTSQMMTKWIDNSNIAASLTKT